MKLVVTGSGLRHLVADSAGARTLCGREYGSWEDAPESRMRDVPPDQQCIRCWDSANRARERLRGELWRDGTPVLPLDFGRGGRVPPAEVKRIRQVHAELERVERQKMGEVTA